MSLCKPIALCCICYSNLMKIGVFNFRNHIIEKQLMMYIVLWHLFCLVRVRVLTFHTFAALQSITLEQLTSKVISPAEN